MVRSRILTLVTSLMAVLSILWLLEFRILKHPQTLSDTITANTIDSPDELKEFLRSPKAILYIDVGWSVYTLLSRPVVLQLRQDVESNTSYKDVVFRRIDLSDQEKSPLWDVMTEWLKENGHNNLLLSNGWSDLIWIKNAKYLSTRSAYREGIMTLRRSTRKSFLPRQHSLTSLN